MSTKNLVLVTILTAIPVISGCGAAADATGVDSSEAAGRSRQALELADAGPLRLVGDAFADVDLEASQRDEIVRLAEQAGARHADVRAEVAALAETVAAQVEAGAVDRAALAPRFAALDKHLDAVAPADREALQRAHDLLDAEQRAALADTLRTRAEEAKAGDGRARLRALADKLDLSEEQRGTIRGAVFSKLGELRELRGESPREQGERLLAAFERDDFDVEQALPVEATRAHRTARREAMLDLAERLVPTLDAGQRKTAAALIRERAAELE